MRWLNSVWLGLVVPAALAQDGYDSELNLGIEAFYADRLDEAVKWFQSAVELRPEDVDVRLRMTLCHARQGELDEAFPALEQYAIIPDSIQFSLFNTMDEFLTAGLLTGDPGASTES